MLGSPCHRPGCPGRYDLTGFNATPYYARYECPRCHLVRTLGDYEARERRPDHVKFVPLEHL
jgi:hypothetical protein